MRTRTRSLIKRYPLPITQRSITPTAVDGDNPFSNNTDSYTFTRGVADACTIQTPSGYEISTLPEGNKSKEVYTIFTNTSLHPSVENSNDLSTGVYIPDSFFGVSGMGGWFTVIKTKPHLNGIIEHFEAMIAKDYNLTSTEGKSQYPDLSTLDPLVGTKEELLEGDWSTSWLAENT
jgi:hypothetical protein